MGRISPSSSPSDNLADAQKVSVWINEGELPQAPRFVGESVEARDALPEKLGLRKIPIDRFPI